MKILYISPYYSTFIHDPIVALESNEEFATFTFFAVNLYLYLKRSIYRRSFAGDELTKEIPEHKQKKIFYHGLPQDFNSHNYPKQIKQKIEKHCKVKEFDVIHAHTIFPSGVAAYLLAEKYEKPFIITSHGFDFYRILPKNNPNHRGNSYKKKEINLIRNSIEKVSALICVSEFFGKHVKQYFPNVNLKIIPNVYDNNLFNKIGRKTHENSSSCVILTVGNFISVKNHEMLIRAFRDISSNFPDIKLQIIGKGELKNFYKKICKELGLLEKIEIIDQANHAEVAAYMKNADIYVQTSNSETFGMTIVEAMACGLPVIATRTQGPSSYIDNGKNGLLIDKNNVKDLVDKLKNLINNPQLRKEIGSKAAEDAASHFGDYAKLIALYREIANNE